MNIPQATLVALSVLGLVISIGLYHIHAAVLLLVKATKEQTEILRRK